MRRVACLAAALVVVALAAAAANATLFDAAASADHPDRITHLPDYGALKSKMYSGYLNSTDGRRAFYVFVESESSPATDPLVLWLNGGPGCSSLLGMFEENGPYTMRHGGRFENNSFGWAQLANILYIESPGSVGFSTDTTPPTNWNDQLAAQFNFAAMQSFFRKFPQFAHHHLYLTGESYAGFYVPELAHMILHSDDATMKASMQGFMVGNPCTGRIGCCNNDPTLDPFLRYNGFMPLNTSIPTDQKATYDPYDLLVPTCASGSTLNRVRFHHPVLDALKKRLAATGPPYPYGPCADDYVTNWLNRADVKAALHAEPSITWSSCNNNIQYQCNLDGVVPMYQDMMDHSSYKIVVYSGLSDSVVNMAQTQTIINDMGRQLKKNEFQAWYLPYVYNSSQTQLGGFFLEYDRISWAGVRNSGHMVPQFNPPAALELFRSYITIGRPGRLHD